MTKRKTKNFRPYINISTAALILMIVAVSCISKRGYHAKNVNYIYDTKELAIRPDYKIYHLSDTITRIYYRLNSSNLLYMREAEGQPYKASLLFNYHLVKSFEETAILDSGNFKYLDKAEIPPQKAIVGYFDINTRVGEDNSYVLRIKIEDRNRQINFDNFLRLDKSKGDGPQNFLLTDTAGAVLFKNHIPTNIPFLIKSERAISEFFVSFYSRKFPLALPPYSSASPESFELDPDTTYKVRTNKPLKIKQNGFYHFRLDTTVWDGFTVYSFYDQFPYIAKKEHLGPPLRYLTTKREYNKITAPEKKPGDFKRTIDEFWLDRSGSLERSKMLLEAYYSRVQEANIFFSSYIEGWKSDRGIIYVIYGPPNKVYRSSAGEAWVYGDETSSLSYRYNFYKVSNPFSENDYSLDRMSSYRYGWGQAIESWRNGRVYNSKDIKREQDESDQNFDRNRLPYRY